MAWQLHYTSARSGPDGRSGFQFTARTPGLPPGTESTVAPFLVYRTPPEAPHSPTPAELAVFPITLAYDQVGGRPMLVRCRYLGQDYSGRFGNFLAHAVVAEPHELVGLRPIEFWEASFWDDFPAVSPDLDPLDDPLPGDAFDPESLGHWLRRNDPYDLLVSLIDAVTRSEDQVRLVARDVERIARWIAVLSCSVPVSTAARLSFVTYTGDPGSSPHRLVGTTPDVWSSLRTDLPAYFLDTSQAPQKRVGSRYARAVADCWQRLDLEGLDALAELAEFNGFEAAAVLLAACKGEKLDLAEQRLAAGLLSQPDLPTWVWPRLDPASLGFELAAAVHAHALDRTQAELAAARCAALALGSHDLRDRLRGVTLTDPLALVPTITAELAAAPDLVAIAEITVIADQLGVPVLAAETQRAVRDRIRTKSLLDAYDIVARRWLPTFVTGLVHGLEAAGSAARREQLGDEACQRIGAIVSAGLVPLDRTPEVALHVLRSLAELDGVHARSTLELARALPGNSAAEGLLAGEGVASERDPRTAAQALEKIRGALAPQTLASVTDSLSHRSPSFRAALLGVAGERIRDQLIHRWTETALSRARRFELMSVALRVPGTPLDDWARAQVSKRLTLLQLEAYFHDDQKLRAALRNLRG